MMVDAYYLGRLCPKFSLVAVCDNDNNIYINLFFEWSGQNGHTQNDMNTFIMSK